MLLEMLEMLEKLSIGQKCPMDIFKGSHKIKKNTNYHIYSPSHHLWCGIFKTKNLLFFTRCKNPQNPNSCHKTQNGHS
jgi:hypothetical protein